MKKYFIVIIASSMFFSCGQKSNEIKDEAGTADSLSMNLFGEKISEENAQNASELPALISGKDSVEVKLKGTISEVCQKKGCWMNLDLSNGQTMKVTFKDYAFFVPKDASGKSAIIDGWAYNDTTSVEELRHYAEDAGKPKEEIEKINQPEASITFEAKGVIIY